MQMADILECKFIYAYSESVFVCAHVCVGKKKKDSFAQIKGLQILHSWKLERGFVFYKWISFKDTVLYFEGQPITQ